MVALPIMRLAKSKPKPVASNGQNRNITPSDADEIARITATGLNESEACAMLGLRREAWFAWKCRNSVKYSDIFTRIRGQRLDNLLKQIDKAATGKDGIRHDWRAADRLLAITAPERFSQRAEASQQPATVNVAIISDLAAKIYAQPAIAGPSKPARTLPDASPCIEAELVADAPKAKDGTSQG